MKLDTRTMHAIAIQAMETADIYREDEDKERSAKTTDLLKLSYLLGCSEALEEFAERIVSQMEETMEGKK